MQFSIKFILPRESKAARLETHVGKIRGKRIYLPEDAIWRDAFIDEVVRFPAEFNDQVDAMTQYLDFMDTKPSIPTRPPRDSGMVVVRRRDFF